MISKEQRRLWDEDGFLILPQFFSRTQIDAIEPLTAGLMRERPDDVVVDDLATGERLRMSQMRAEQEEHHFKVNDLYLKFDEIRGLSLDERLCPILAELLGGAPVVCNSLNFEFGSQQSEHIDSIFMTPRTPGSLAATWIALEDCSPDAGLLFYYPGSHKIPPYRFSNGRFHCLPGEMPLWTDYILSQLKARNLAKETFVAKAGDCFIWSANLVHGGSEIRNQTATRKSLVTHYFTLSDCQALGMPLAALNAGYWLVRPNTLELDTRREKVRRMVRRLGAQLRSWAIACARAIRRLFREIRKMASQ